MKILEIFNSIQGEGNFMGIPCTFVRTAGCSLRCSFCDTKASWGSDKADLEIKDIVAACTKPFVVITGGEPTEQAEELKVLIRALHAQDKFVAIESNGTYEHYDGLGADWVTVSPKAAAMYCLFTAGVNELKYVVTKDFDDKVAINEATRAAFKGYIWLQPCDYHDEILNRQMYQKVMNIVHTDYRLRAGIQLHKIYGVE